MDVSPSHSVEYQELGDEIPRLLFGDDQLEPLESVYDSPDPDLVCLDLEDEIQAIHPMKINSAFSDLHTTGPVDSDLDEVYFQVFYRCLDK